MRNTAVMVAALLGLAACTTTGTGTGEQRHGSGLTASFNWRESDPQGGTMNAGLSDGRNYDGRYFQITRETTVDRIQPLFMGWNGGYGRWGGRGLWGGYDNWGPSADFVTHYSGKVLANLDGPGGHMRCRFQLARPSSGMSGGGSGRCQLPGGKEIDADFPPHS